ncbi:hypothetical protein HBH70_083080 [Parastagonospora nodorum]|nr:hypothetical protein HBH53_209660 [Parastagonospora nodorum]KAH3978461.1 hypothetical protein HBH52_109750 [Parastagonospora nodorum]KAH4001413.1 hypothetical protein HBI10_091580 [Parastagonospora nodorum]KAH4027537.1 hypothetical protein HBI13_060600 [Parastagonospora nodorum]KAH4068891.1 hypothetical protein HBH50_120330 [Parastagonospora nodorum]
MIQSCEQQAQSFIIIEVASTCSQAQVYLTLDSENPLSQFVPTYSDLATTSSGTALSTSAVVASTSAFVPTTVLISITTATAQTSLSTAESTSILSAATDVPSTFSAPEATSSLSPKAIGGIAAGASVVGLAVVAYLIWFVMRRRRNSNIKHEQNTIEQPGTYDQKSQGDGTEKQETFPQDVKVIYQHHNAIQELPGDDPPQSSMISELDSIRPVSELEYIAYNGDRSAASPGARVVSPILPNIVEMGERKSSPPPDDVALPAQDGDDGAIPDLSDNNRAAGKQTDETFLPAQTE